MTLQDQKGGTFLKLPATNFIINSLICGKAARNASLAGGSKMQELKHMGNAQLSHTPGEPEAGEEAPEKRRRCVETVVEVDPEEVKGHRRGGVGHRKA